MDSIIRSCGLREWREVRKLQDILETALQFFVDARRRMSLRAGIRTLHFSVLFGPLIFIACLTRRFFDVYRLSPSITAEFIASRLLQNREAVMQFEAALCNQILQIKNMTETWEEMYDTMGSTSAPLSRLTNDSSGGGRAPSLWLLPFGHRESLGKPSSSKPALHLNSSASRNHYWEERYATTDSTSALALSRTYCRIRRKLKVQRLLRVHKMCAFFQQFYNLTRSDLSLLHLVAWM